MCNEGTMKKASLVIYSLYLFIVCLVFPGCNRKSDRPFANHFVTFRYGNPKDGGIELLLPSSASYQRAKSRTRIRFIWEDERGNEYSFVTVIVKGQDDIAKIVEKGRSREGWQLIVKTSFQTISGYNGKLLLFRKESRLAEWICFPFENYPGGVVIYWFSTMQQYNANRKVLHSLFKRAKLFHPILPKVKGVNKEAA